MTPYDDLKARAQKALDKDDWATLRGLFVDASAVAGVGGVQTQDSGPHGPPPPPPPVV